MEAHRAFLQHAPGLFQVAETSSPAYDLSWAATAQDGQLRSGGGEWE